MTQKWLPGSLPRVTPSDSKWLKNGVRSHFWVNFGSLWGRSAQITFESLLDHFNFFCVSVCLGGCPLHKIRVLTAQDFYTPLALTSQHCKQIRISLPEKLLLAAVLWRGAKGAEKASCGETVVQNAKMDSKIPSMKSMVFRCLRASLKEQRRKRTLQKHHFGRPFPHTMPSPILWRVLIWGTAS